MAHPAGNLYFAGMFLKAYRDLVPPSLLEAEPWNSGISKCDVPGKVRALYVVSWMPVRLHSPHLLPDSQLSTSVIGDFSFLASLSAFMFWEGVS